MVKYKIANLNSSTLEDLKNLLDRKGDLPGYVSKEHVCGDLVQLLGSNISKLQKNEVTISILFILCELHNIKLIQSNMLKHS